MISDYERREIAAKLRELADSNEGCLGMDRVNRVLRDGQAILGTSGLASVADVLRRHADLIDRPTAKREHNGAYWRCAHCGAFTRKDAVIIDGLDVVPLRHCGNCGMELDYD